MNKPMNKQQGGSYLKDPKTGKTKLVSQTEQREITKLETPSQSVSKSEPKKTTGEK